MKTALDIHQDLLARSVAHEVVRLPRPLTRADDLPDVAGLPAGRCAVVRIFLGEHDRLTAAVVPAGGQPDVAALMRVAETRVLAVPAPELVSRRTDYAAGLVSPFLLPEDIVVIADVALLDEPVVYTATGESGTALGIDSGLLVRESRARLADLTAHEPTRLLTPR